VPHPSADIFSLGVLVYEMTTGRLPWPVQTWEQAASVQRKPPAPLPKSVPGKEILAALSLDPAKRPTAADLAQKFGDISSPAPTLIAKGAFASGSARVPDQPTRTHELTPITAPARRRSPHLAAASTLIVLLVALGMVFLAAALMQSSNGNGFQPTLPKNSTGAPPANPTPNPATAGPASASEAIALLRTTIDAAVLAGDVSNKRAENLRQRVADIAERVQRPNRARDTVNKLEDLRDEVADMAKDGEITAAAAASLDALIGQAIAKIER
jgi:serine/threonine-protein kinase